MKTLSNLFGKQSIVKNINDFNHFSLNQNQMISIKGGTQPIGNEGPPPPPPTIGGGI